jgi:hypothetical protein
MYNSSRVATARLWLLHFGEEFGRDLMDNAVMILIQTKSDELNFGSEALE